MNLFEFLKNYRDPKTTQTYGDILEGYSDITEGMTANERAAYQQLKLSDNNRFKLNENRNLINNVKIPPQPVNVSGVGKAIQMC